MHMHTRAHTDAHTICRIHAHKCLYFTQSTVHMVNLHCIHVQIGCLLCVLTFAEPDYHQLGDKRGLGRQLLVGAYKSARSTSTHGRTSRCLGATWPYARIAFSVPHTRMHAWLLVPHGRMHALSSPCHMAVCTHGFPGATCPYTWMVFPVPHVRIHGWLSRCHMTLCTQAFSVPCMLYSACFSYHLKS